MCFAYYFLILIKSEFLYNVLSYMLLTWSHWKLNSYMFFVVSTWLILLTIRIFLEDIDRFLQLIKQSINQSNNQSINQSNKQSNKQSINQSNNQSINQTINQFFFHVAISDSVQWLPYLEFVPGPARITSKGLMSLLFE